MRKLDLTLMAAILGATLAGCATPPPSIQQQAAQQEKLLAAAGFNARPADTPRKMAQLQKLPPYQVLMRFRDQQPVYVYADRVLPASLLDYKKFTVEPNSFQPVA